MKKKEDPGLKYIRKLGISISKSAENSLKEISDKCGSDVHDEYKKYLNSETPGFFSVNYSGKNGNYDTAMIFTGGMDADIIRKLCNHLEKNTGYIGKNILEVGCENGFLTGFLAEAFPESSITAIDLCEENVANTKKNLEKFDAGNVNVTCCGLDGVEGSFDTVIASRVIYENYDGEENTDPLPLSLQIEDGRKKLSAFVEKLAEKTAEGGHIFSVSYTEPGALNAAFMYDLAEKGAGVLTDTVEVIKARSFNEETPLYVFFARKGLRIAEDEIRNLWTDSLEINEDADRLMNASADLVLERTRGALIEGYYFIRENGEKAGSAALYESAAEDGKLLNYKSYGGNSMLEKAEDTPENRTEIMAQVVKQLGGFLEAYKLKLEDME